MGWPLAQHHEECHRQRGRGCQLRLVQGVGPPKTGHGRQLHHSLPLRILGRLRGLRVRVPRRRAQDTYDERESSLQGCW